LPASSSIRPALGHSLVISLGALLASLVIGIPAAYALARYKFAARESIAFTFLSAFDSRPNCRQDLGLPAHHPADDRLDRPRLF
jgi:hypothetical protein